MPPYGFADDILLREALTIPCFAPSFWIHTRSVAQQIISQMDENDVPTQPHGTTTATTMESLLFVWARVGYAIVAHWRATTVLLSPFHHG